jgi:acyl carrier protein
VAKFDEKLFRETVIRELALKEKDYRDDLKIGEVTSWDSLGHLDLVSSLETTFHVKFDIDMILELNSLEKLKEAIAKK